MKVTAKRVLRVVQVVLLLLLIAYLAVLGSANPQTIDLLFFIPLPTAWVIASALLLGFAAGWASLSGRVLRSQRENRGLRQRLIKGGLEADPHRNQHRTETHRADGARTSTRKRSAARDEPRLP